MITVFLSIERTKYENYLSTRYAFFEQELKLKHLTSLLYQKNKIERKGNQFYFINFNQQYPADEQFLNYLVNRINHLEVVETQPGYEFNPRGAFTINALEKKLHFELGQFFNFSQHFLIRVNQQIYLVQDTFTSDDLYRNEQEKNLKKYQSLVALFNAKVNNLFSRKIGSYLDLNDVTEISIQKRLKKSFTLFPQKNRLVEKETDRNFKTQNILVQLQNFHDESMIKKVYFQSSFQLQANLSTISMKHPGGGVVLSIYQKLGSVHGNFLTISSFPQLIFELKNSTNPYLFEIDDWKQNLQKAQNEVQ